MSHPSQVVIALDQGSSSSRALAFNEHGRVVARARFPVRTAYPKPGWVEHDAADLASTLERSLDAVLAALPPTTEVVAAGLAAQRSTVVLWDVRTGRPAAPAPSWMDARAAELVAPMAARKELQHEVHAKTGLYLTPYYSAPKIMHMLEHEPKARALADDGRLRIGPVSSYILWRLSKGEVFRTDPAMAQRMLLFDIRKSRWDEGLCSMFGVPPESLPRLAPNAGLWCEIRRGRRRFPILAVMGDQQSAALGQGGSEPGIGVLNYGTGAFFLLHTGQRCPRVPGLLTSVAWQRRRGPVCYFLEGTVHAAGTSFDWLKRYLGLLRDVRRVDSVCRKSTHRVLALQSIGGLGAPRWDYRTPTVFMGLRSKTRPEDIVRGVTESIAFLISDIVEAVRKSGHQVRELRASGGLARIDHLLQFQADLLQQKVSRLGEREATALGVASLAAEEADVPWAEALRTERVDTEFLPCMDPAKAIKLGKGWRKFVSAQQELSQSLSRLGVFE